MTNDRASPQRPLRRRSAAILVLALAGVVGAGAYWASERAPACSSDEQAILNEVPHVGGSDVQGRSRDGGCEARLRVDAPPAAVVDHYARELQRLGWQIEERSDGGGELLAVRYDFTGSKGSPTFQIRPDRPYYDPLEPVPAAEGLSIVVIAP